MDTGWGCVSNTGEYEELYVENTLWSHSWGVFDRHGKGQIRLFDMVQEKISLYIVTA